MSKGKKIIITAFIVQVVAFFAFWFVSRTQNLDLAVLTGDSSSYRTLAENLLQNRVFSSSLIAPFSPESFRTPGYPLLLAVLFFFLRNWIVVLFAQGLLVAFLPLLVYLVGKRLNEKAAFLASLIFIFEPTRIFLSNTLLSDILFSLLLIASLFFFLRFFDEFKTKDILISGLLLGFAVLVRAVAVFLPVIFLAYLFGQARNSKIIWKSSAVFLLGFLIFVFPWSLRNKLIFNSWQLSSVGSYNLAYYNATQFQHYKTGEPLEKLVAEFNKFQGGETVETPSLAKVSLYNDFSRSLIGSDPLGYFKFHLLKTLPFFVTDGLRDIARSFNLLRDEPPNLSSLIAKGRWQDLKTFTREGGLAFLLFFLGFVFWVLVSVLAAVGAIREFFRKSESRGLIMFFAVLILYFALLTGPVSNARYRLPASVFMLIFACLFLVRNFERKILGRPNGG